MSTPVCLSVKLVLGTFLSMNSVLNSSGKSCLFMCFYIFITKMDESMKGPLKVFSIIRTFVFLERSKEALAMLTGCVPVSCQRSRLIIT